VAYKRRPAGGLAIADGLDPAPVFELLDDLAADRHAADIFDVASGHGLAVGHDGQGLHGSSRVLRRLLGVQTIKVLAHLGPALEAPARGQRHQFDAPPCPVELNSSSRLRRVSTPIWSSKSARMSRTGMGAWAHMRAVSSTRLASDVFIA
jgi:hypothetical protein